MTHMHDEIDRILVNVNAQAKKQDKLSGFCIGNTRKINSTGLYFSPIRNTAKLVAGSVIVYSADQAGTLAQYIDGKVDYILVDTEKKISPELYTDENVGNVERTVRENVTTSKILTYKGNDLTVDSIENLIAEILSSYPRGLSGKNATIIGAGNIGSKLALKLVERGMNVTITRRNQEKLEAIVTALNYIKPAETISSVTGTADNMMAASGANLLVGLTNGNPSITPEMIDALAPGAILLDAGKGCFTQDAVQLAMNMGMSIYRADIRPGFAGHSEMVLNTEQLVKNTLGRKVICGVPIVSGGLLGRMNEVVVDNVNAPQSIFGLANGMGDFIRNLNPMQQELITIVENYLDKNNGSLS